MARKERWEMKFLAAAQDYLLAVFLAAAGGLAKLLHTKNKKRMKIGAVLGDMFVAAFCGLIAMLLVRAGEFDNRWLGLLCGLAGWIGPPFITWAMTKIGFNPPEEKETKK